MSFSSQDTLCFLISLTFTSHYFGARWFRILPTFPVPATTFTWAPISSYHLPSTSLPPLFSLPSPHPDPFILWLSCSSIKSEIQSPITKYPSSIRFHYFCLPNFWSPPKLSSYFITAASSIRLLMGSLAFHPVPLLPIYPQMISTTDELLKMHIVSYSKKLWQFPSWPMLFMFSYLYAILGAFSSAYNTFPWFSNPQV